MSFKSARARLDAASPRPWSWWGNVDHSDPSLIYWGPMGVTEVMTHVRVERTPDDLRIRDLGDYFDEGQVDSVRREFLFEDDGETPRTDDRLAFVVDGRLKAARELPVFEVCRSATERSDPRVYRADIVDVRHPDARLMAHAPTDLAAALDVIEVAKAEHHRQDPDRVGSRCSCHRNAHDCAVLAAIDAFEALP